MKGVERSRRVGELLLKEISLLVYNKVKDPRVRGATITYVKMSGDLSIASVYFVTDKELIGETLDGLEHSAGFIRHNLKDKLKMKIIPKLRFFYDESFDYGEKIDRIIDNLEHKK